MISWGIGALVAGALLAAHVKEGRALGRDDVALYGVMGLAIGLLGWWSLAAFGLTLLYSCMKINDLDDGEL